MKYSYKEIIQRENENEVLKADRLEILAIQERTRDIIDGLDMPDVTRQELKALSTELYHIATRFM